MNNIRIIPRLDIKGKKLIKGVNLEGLRVIGDPQEFARKYYSSGADELLYMDAVASLYDRNSLEEIVSYTAKNIFIPFTVGGGIRCLDDATRLLRSGADKVAVNTAAISRPTLITDIANKFGSQAMVLSVEAKKIEKDKWEAYVNNGRDKTGLDVIDWVKEGVERGAGEILLTSIDREGTRKGYEIELISNVSKQISVPLIVSGGMGDASDMIDAIKIGHADAIAMADILHYNRATIRDLHNIANKNYIPVRML